MIIEGIVKGDTINLELSINQVISGWKIRCEIFDNSNNSIKLATLNSNGSDEQILITNSLKGEFTIKVPKGLTSCFNDKSFIEVEVENTSGEIFTPIIGKDSEIRFINQKIDWVSP
jgi:hypothetical protein